MLPEKPCREEDAFRKRGREKDPSVLLVMGRDDLLLKAYLGESAVLSDIDTQTWRNRASLRVRYSSIGACLRGSWSSQFGSDVC